MFWFGSVFALLVLIPAVRLLRRAGRSGWLALLLLVPLVNVVFVWWLAFSRSARVSPTPALAAAASVAVSRRCWRNGAARFG